MTYKLAPRATQTLPIVHSEAVNRAELTDAAIQKAILRRRMYERIAQGNALAESEVHANRKWQ